MADIEIAFKTHKYVPLSNINAFFDKLDAVCILPYFIYDERTSCMFDMSDVCHYEILVVYSSKVVSNFEGSWTLFKV